MAAIEEYGGHRKSLLEMMLSTHMNKVKERALWFSRADVFPEEQTSPKALGQQRGWCAQGLGGRNVLEQGEIQENCVKLVSLCSC